jgi:AbrB family looped-hinge helix DNA binding protein
MTKYETGKLSTKGQVVIPSSIREILDIGEGDRIAFFQEGDQITVKGIKKTSILDSIGVIKIDKKYVDVNKIREEVRLDMIAKEISNSE